MGRVRARRGGGASAGVVVRAGGALVGRGAQAGMGIIWIASYPKSGNTWVRFLLANYLAGPITASAQTEEAVPGLDVRVDIRPKLARRNPLCMKTHYPWKADHPHAALSDKAVVVVRFPKDVLLSNLNYQRLIHGTDEGFSDADYARAFIGAGGDPIRS